jgi:hypothetical protein
MRIGLILLVAAGVLAFGARNGTAEEQGKGERGKRAGERGEMRKEIRDEIEKFVAEQKEKRKAHHEQQMEENKAFIEGVKGETPQEIAKAIKDHRETQFNENKQFADQMQTARKDFITSLAANKNIPADLIEKVLARCEEAYKEFVAHFEKQHEENMALLDQLAAKNDLTKEALREAIKAQIEKQKAENKEFLEKWKDEFKKRRAERKNNPK